MILLCLMAVPTFVMAQSDCEAMLQAANQYYNNGEYEKAARMYQLIKEDCGNNYGGVNAKLTDCNNKIQEDAAYNQCTTVEACDAYLRNYPNGRYVQSVQQKRNALAASQQRDAEDRAYANCNTIQGCRSYLNQYPNGRYASQVRSKLQELENNQWNGNEGGTGSNNRNNNRNNNDWNNNDGGTGNDSRNNNNNNNWNNNDWNNNDGGTDNNSRNNNYNNNNYPSGGGVDIRSGNWIAALKNCLTYTTRTYDNGSYKGQMSNGIRSGLGIYYWDDGDFHVGRYSDGTRNGMGIYFMKTGTFSNCPNCVIYVGDWDDGKKSGTGTCYDQYGNLLYYGEFSNERPTDAYPSSGYSSYRFEVKQYTNGNFYIGETKNGERHGMGIFVWKEGGIWYGPWIDGERSGYGIYMPLQGSMTTGNWNGDDME